MNAQVAPASSNANKTGTDVIKLLKGRASQEFVIGVMGAVGCGLPRIVTEFEEQLEKLGYKVVRIKVSDFIKSQIENQTVSIPAGDHSNRYMKYQSGGNELRRQFGNEVMAEYAISHIIRNRLAIDPDLQDLSKELPRVAYIIDQIKHPAEVALLRTVYRNNFYLVGVMSLEANRITRLEDDGLRGPVIDTIVSRDRKEGDKFGQQLERAFKLADYFMHHPLGDKKLVPAQVKRFLDLTHGNNSITPTKHEHAMYVAYSTAMKSSCLSRQVGAAITDSSSRIVAVGTNDVPQYKGGLYTGDGPLDDRCFQSRKICENSAEKSRRRDKIKAGIQEKFTEVFKDPKMAKAAMAKVDEISEFVYEQSGIPDLIEFSRAVHAEMDALISLSRGGGGSTVGGNLYATTFPCHNCARHILAAGIDKVYYIEPYEKSLAPEAHNDAIEVLDHDDDSASVREEDGADKVPKPPTKLRFVHFSGVGPRMYPELFQRETRKDDAGYFTPSSTSAAGTLPLKIVHEYIDSHRVFEVKVASLFEEQFPPPQPPTPPPPVLVPVQGTSANDES